MMPIMHSAADSEGKAMCNVPCTDFGLFVVRWCENTLKHLEFLELNTCVQKQTYFKTVFYLFVCFFF